MQKGTISSLYYVGSRPYSAVRCLVRRNYVNTLDKNTPFLSTFLVEFCPKLWERCLPNILILNLVKLSKSGHFSVSKKEMKGKIS